MKKLLLVSLCALPVMGMAQKSNFPTVAPEFGTAVPALPKTLVDITPSLNPNNPAYYAAKTRPEGINFIQVGKTQYDLQTNSSIGRRIVLHNDGNVSVTWTTAPDGTPGFPNRGSGYNYGEGSSFVRQGNQNGDRVDNYRAGWPSIGVLPGGIEYIVAHDANNGGFRIAKNTEVGGQTWTTGPAILQYSGGQRPTWNRTANNGNTLHLISNFSDSSLPSQPRVITINGVIGPMTYSRSLDGGVTWDKNNTLLPGYDSTRIYNGGGDNYAIDVSGDVVAIVHGGLGDDVTLWKSTDNGETFTKIIVDSFKYAPMNYKTIMADTPYCNDGALDVVIDNNGDCHVVWGMSRVLDTDTTNETVSLFPSTALLAYWGETSGVTQFIASVIDENMNDTLDIMPGTWANLANGQIPQGLRNVARTGNTSLVTMPTAGVDANGRIFVTYSAPRERDMSIDDVNCRDIYIVYSTDNGVNWSEPQNVTQAQGLEDAFPCMAKRVDDFVHIVWQQDETPGTNGQNLATGGNNQPVTENRILYAAIPVSKLLANELGQGNAVSIGQMPSNNAEVFTVSQNYPNPFANETNVLIYLTEMSNLNLTVTNLMGQTVINRDLGTFAPGNSTLTIDAKGLSAGVYTYTISTGNNSVGNKMIVR